MLAGPPMCGTFRRLSTGLNLCGTISGRGTEPLTGAISLSSASRVIHVAPADQPTGVHQITERLFPAYTVEGGSVRLAGCLLEDRVFVRLEFRQGDRSVEVIVDDRGEQVDPQFVDTLGMTETIRLETPPELMGPDIRRLVEAGTRLVEEQFAEGDQPILVATTVVWCKFAEGKLRFTIAEQGTELPFAGWARLLEPPPFVCPYTGRRTFHLAATDDGRIAAADRIEVCSETGRRVLADDLVTCSVTGRRALPESMATCPVSEEYVLGEAMVACGTCRQLVSPKVVERNECAACRRLESVGKADPRMARLLDEHPLLDRWRRWRISETATSYLLTASGWLRQLLVVVDKDSLELKLLATGNRFFAGWNVVEPSQYEYVLRE